MNIIQTSLNIRTEYGRESKDLSMYNILVIMVHIAKNCDKKETAVGIQNQNEEEKINEIYQHGLT